MSDSRAVALAAIRERWRGKTLPPCNLCGGKMEWFCCNPDDDVMHCAVILCERADDTCDSDLVDATELTMEESV